MKSWLVVPWFCLGCVFSAPLSAGGAADRALPAPALNGPMSLEHALQTRRSVRRFQPDALTLAEAGQLLWAAQGITEPGTGKRTAPSARAQYFLNAYLIVNRVKGLPPGLYQYHADGHRLARLRGGDVTGDVMRAGGQGSLRQAAAVVALTGKPASRREWVCLEAGHAAQNVLLQATALGLGSVPVAGFDPDRLAAALRLSKDETLIYLLPVGKP